MTPLGEEEHDFSFINMTQNGVHPKSQQNIRKDLVKNIASEKRNEKMNVLSSRKSIIYTEDLSKNLLENILNFGADEKEKSE